MTRFDWSCEVFVHSLEWLSRIFIRVDSLICCHEAILISPSKLYWGFLCQYFSNILFIMGPSPCIYCSCCVDTRILICWSLRAHRKISCLILRSWFYLTLTASWLSGTGTLLNASLCEVNCGMLSKAEVSPCGLVDLSSSLAVSYEFTSLLIPNSYLVAQTDVRHFIFILKAVIII